MSVEMNIYKQLEQYWRMLAQAAHHNELHEIQVNSTSNLSLSDAPSFFVPGNLTDPVTLGVPNGTISSWQTSTVLDMFWAVVRTTLPHYKHELGLAAAIPFWRLLTRPIMLEQEQSFDDPDFEEDREFLRRQSAASSSSSSSLAASTSSSSLPSSPLSSNDDLPSVSPEWDFKAQFKPDEQGFFLTPTGRRIDGLTDFLLIHDHSLDTVLTLLEFSIAFLRGVSLLDWNDVAGHIGLNVERILHNIIVKRRPELVNGDRQLPARILDCIVLFCFWYGAREKYGAITSMLLLAHHLAVDTEMHTQNPLVAGRIYNSLIWWARSNEQREEFLALGKKYFPEVVGSDWMMKFCYVSSVVRTEAPVSDDEHKETWDTCSEYLNDAHTMAHLMEKAKHLSKCSVAFFKISVCMLKAEISLRQGENDTAMKQISYMHKILSDLNDRDTFILVQLVRYHCSQTRGISSTFAPLGDAHITLREYILQQVESVPTMPILPQPPLGPTPPQSMPMNIFV
jgi:hypothetical protein